jgi:hypothetical protein
VIAGSLFGLPFDYEDRDITFFRKVGGLLPDYIVSLRRSSTHISHDPDWILLTVLHYKLQWPVSDKQVIVAQFSSFCY